MLATEGAGYGLRLEPGQLDLARFEDLFERGTGALGAGDPSAAVAALSEGLALFHGPPLMDVA